MFLSLPILITVPLHTYSFFFFFNDTAPTEIYPLPLPALLPIYRLLDLRSRRTDVASSPEKCAQGRRVDRSAAAHADLGQIGGDLLEQDRQQPRSGRRGGPVRSEEHTSELQSHLNLVCRLLLQKK